MSRRAANFSEGCDAVVTVTIFTNPSIVPVVAVCAAVELEENDTDRVKANVKNGFDVPIRESTGKLCC